MISIDKCLGVTASLVTVAGLGLHCISEYFVPAPPPSDPMFSSEIALKDDPYPFRFLKKNLPCSYSAMTDVFEETKQFKCPLNGLKKLMDCSEEMEKKALLLSDLFKILNETHKITCDNYLEWNDNFAKEHSQFINYIAPDDLKHPVMWTIQPDKGRPVIALKYVWKEGCQPLKNNKAFEVKILFSEKTEEDDKVYVGDLQGVLPLSLILQDQNKDTVLQLFKELFQTTECQTFETIVTELGL